MTPMQAPTAPQAPAPQAMPSDAPTQLDPREIAHETGYSVQRVMADIARTHAETKEALYPAFYGQESQGIPPGLARMASGQGDDQSAPQLNEPGAIPGEEMESPQRAQARAAMAGGPGAMQEMNEAPADEATEPPAQQAMEQSAGTEMQPDREALAVMAQRSRQNLHERARKMKHRF